MDVLPEVLRAGTPDRIVVLFDSGESFSPSDIAQSAVDIARSVMPKVTGALAARLMPIFGENYAGIYFPDKRVWFLEQGTRPFTMHAIAGKVIPMWFDDPTGQERRDDPKAKTRTTVDGRVQVLKFRKVGTKAGAKVAKTVQRPGTETPKVARYPGQAGRIARRESARPLTTPGRQGGRIAKGNVGVAWRHPGVVGRHFLNYALTVTTAVHGIAAERVYLVDAASFRALVTV